MIKSIIGKSFQLSKRNNTFNNTLINNQLSKPSLLPQFIELINNHRSFSLTLSLHDEEKASPILLNNNQTNNSTSTNNNSGKSNSEEKSSKSNKSSDGGGGGGDGKKKSSKTFSVYMKKWLTYGVLTTIAITSVNYQDIVAEKKSIEWIKDGSRNTDNNENHRSPSLNHHHLWISREEEVKNLESLISTNHDREIAPSYILVVGRKGDGKSNISKELSKKIGKSCIHIQFQRDMKEIQIVEEIAKAVRYYPFMNRNDLPLHKYIVRSFLEIVRPSKPTFSEMTHVLKSITSKMKDEELVPYFIFDGVDTLVKKNNESVEFNLLPDLIELCKEGSTNNWFGSVLFTNEEGMKHVQSSSGRYAISNIYYLPGIKKLDAISYLSQSTSRENAEILVNDICGDHLKTILDVSKELKMNLSNEEIIQHFVKFVKQNLRGLELGQIPNNKEAFAVWNLLYYMSKNGGECTISEASICIGYENKPLQVIIENLISRDLIRTKADGQLSFYNNAVGYLVNRSRSRNVDLFHKFDKVQPKERILDF
ncbi:predicted protein [Naegleria gruberi]|uniref:Predicted protein n=1 Tax=Naegleria gruberi TaxID=5762 RepID=D2VC29_NAEGR|nr:uncharacterized protein NAEGRDRAFT_66425 [Naegleria gruberi]EFC45586.1 predicted protein [Naegleria gruberi]|eukprot:XP_002678330.1 predicted protein [Naegleria gruberi strain NEG-M]